MLQKSFVALCIACICLVLAPLMQGAEVAPPIAVGGLNNPQGVTASADGRIFISTAGGLGKDGDGAIVVVKNGTATTFASGLDDPKGIVAHHDSLYVVDKNRVWKIDAAGKPTVLAAADTFPSRPRNLSAIAVEYEKGTLYLGDVGDSDGKGAAIYRVGTGGSVDTILDGSGRADFGCPSGLVLDGASFLLVADSKRQCISRVKIADGGPNGGVSVIPRPGEEPVLLPGSEPAKAISAHRAARELVMVTADGVKATKVVIPGAEVEESPLPLEAVMAFPKLQWANWSPETPE